jgi:ABC-type sugar transport system ATPase subunit
MSDRIAVMRNKTIAGMLERENATQQNILALALHETSATPRQ